MAVLFALERGWSFRFEASSRVVYERIELIQPTRYAELLADLRARTGFPVTRATVGRIDFLRDSAEVTLYYDATMPPARSVAQQAQDGRSRASA